MVKSMFTYNSVWKLLSNRRYIGENRFKDIVMPDSIPAIVDKELFDRVQAKIEKNRYAPAHHKAEGDYLLTTKLFSDSFLADPTPQAGHRGEKSPGNAYQYIRECCLSL